MTKKRARLEQRLVSTGGLSLATRGANRAEFYGELPHAQSLAKKAGLELVKCTKFHFQLRSESPRWIVNIYPGQKKIWIDPNNAPKSFTAPRDWSLLDLVATIIEAQSSNHLKE